jgi:VWFA-related protein
VPHTLFSRSYLPGVCLAMLFIASMASPVNAQTAVPDGNGHLVFRRNAHTVVLDIVVTGKDGQPALGLHKEDFEVTEDGHPQKVTYFEEHHSQTSPTNLAALPPGIFTNIPRVTPTDSVTVLLLDSLNTQLQDQGRVHKQILAYLKTLQPGRRIAIFTLGNRLRFIQGFTNDTALLVAALNDPKNGSMPVTSSLLKSTAETTAANEPLSLLGAAAAAQPNQALTNALNNLQQFQAEQSAAQNDVRVSMTIDAFQELAHYLAGIPGRKNVVWFSSAFPLVLFPDTSLKDEFATERDFGDKIKEADALMAASQVSIYPVAAEGLATDKLYSVEQASGTVIGASQDQQPVAGIPQGQRAQQLAGVPQGQIAQQQEISTLQGDALGRNAAHTAMDEIARDTGGEAFYNTNGLNDAIARVANDGSSFYTLTYTPTNNAEDGLFRKIQAKLVKKTSTSISGSSLRMAYRRGYYADTASHLQNVANKSAGDPLHPYMGPGMPESTQIPFALRVLAGPRIPAGAPKPNERDPSTQTIPRAGDNPDLARLAGQSTRYRLDFVIAARGLDLEPAAANARHGLVEATVVVYSQEGRPLNWLVRQVNLDMDDKRYATVQENGVNFSFAIDAPQAGVFLRAGIYDQLSNLAGTLEIPLSSVPAAPAANR